MKTTLTEMYAYENYTSRDVCLRKLHTQMYAYKNYTQRCTLMKTTQAEITLMKSSDLAGSLSC